MAKRIIIDPVTRIEGHAKITIYFDDQDLVTDARFHVTEFRGFERFCEGRPFFEMAGLSARICGICPVSHLLASAKAGDRILAVAIPPAAVKLRRLMNLAQIIQSHALSFFHLSAPDLLLGWDADPARRNVFGLIEAHPELARGGIRLRQLGQEIIEALGGRKIHPAWAVPGGVRASLPVEARDRFLARLPEAHRVTRQAIDFFKGFLDAHAEETQVFGNFPSLFMGLVTKEGDWENYDGRLRFMDSAGQIVHEGDPTKFEKWIGETVEKDSYLKSPYYRPLGYPDGVYRVGPLARVNICRRMGVPQADQELAEFRQRVGGVANASFHFHHARLIEILACLEFLERLLPDPELQSDMLRADAGVNCLEGVGVSEAPRGTLFHHYHVDKHGLLQKVNLVIATGQNALAMNRTVAQIAKHYIKGPKIEEPILNRVEAGIRAFDPCLSCSTHAAGQMPLHIELRRVDGTLIDEVRRN
ncbi:MAG: Ni/Fe hydrogenase subunit alpha [Planctomycetes bacterium]|nr:Ni/Fe hydrogenase subunit alpha [Planctomycetota bacterium]